jgi:hypothetical protein
LKMPKLTSARTLADDEGLSNSDKHPNSPINFAWSDLCWSYLLATHQQKYKKLSAFFGFSGCQQAHKCAIFLNLKILKPYGNHNLEHDLQISSRHPSGKTASPEFCLGCWTRHKWGNVIVIGDNDDDNNSKQILTHCLRPCLGSI